MSREIKFRGFYKYIKEMEYYDTVAFLNFKEDVLCYQKSPEKEPCGFSDMSGIELMQFTGLKDNNGKDIYEGDIVVHHDGELTFKAIVKWDYWSWYLKGVIPEDNFQFEDVTDKNKPDVEVIGNIYENPELLEVHQ